MAVVHVIGGGLAGLSAAVKVAASGGRAVVYERAPACGGRCRSFHDPALGLTIDNGNHLILSGNHALMEYLALIGAAARLRDGGTARFPMVDLATGAHGALDLGRGRWPWPLLRRRGRPPGVRLADLARLGKIFRGRPAETVVDRVGPDCPLMRAVWEPLTLAVLNETPEHGAADLLAAVLRETVLKGGSACRPQVAKANLSETFIDPALAFLAARGAIVRTGMAVTGLEAADGVLSPENRSAASPVRALLIGRDRGRLALDADDGVVLAVPPNHAAALLPGTPCPAPGETIVNLHFERSRSDMPPDSVPDSGSGSDPDPILVGLLGGTAQWLFPRPEIWSVTISAAGTVADQDAGRLGPAVWAEIAPVIQAMGYAGVSGSVPAFRVIKERRATFAQRPISKNGDDRHARPGARTGWPNVWLAGDWTDTGLPATMEGAVRSGFRAGMAALDAEPRLY